MHPNKLFNVFAEHAAAKFGPYDWDEFMTRGRLSSVYEEDSFQRIRNIELENSTQYVPLSYAFISKHFTSLGSTESERLEMLDTAAPQLMEWALFEAHGRTRKDFCSFLEANWDLIPGDWREGAVNSDEAASFSSKSLKTTKPVAVKENKDLASPTNLKKQDSSVPQPAKKITKPVFIIHGHDEVRKGEIYHFLHNMTSIKPVILHQQPSNGDTIIEKLERVAQQPGYAVALLTADDIGRAAKSPSTSEEPRGRQNVVFEAGYFMALLGRKKVVLLKDKGVEDIGDLKGVVYISFEANGWKAELAAELESAGYEIDWPRINH